MNILIVGVPNVVKDSVVKLALDRLEGRAGFRLLSFSEFEDSEEGSVNELDFLKETQKKIKDNIQMKMLKAEPGQHTIINGYCSVDTRAGYAPILTLDSIDIFKPDMLVLVEVDPIALYGKIKNRERYLEYQSEERSVALLSGAKSGSAVKIIKVGADSIRKGANELIKLLKDIMVEK